MSLDTIDYFNDELFDDEFQADIDPRNDIMLTNAGDWTDAQVENYKGNKRKENDMHIIKYIRETRREKARAIADREEFKKKLKRNFAIAFVGALGTGMGGWLWLSLAS